MPTDRTRRPIRGRSGVSELWLTPLLGLLVLGLYTLHNHHSLWHYLGIRLIPVLLLAVPLLLATGAIQQRLRATRWPAVTGWFIGAIIAGLLVRACYLYAAAHYYLLFPLEMGPHGPMIDEGVGDDIAILQGDAEVAGVIAALAAFASGCIASAAKPREHF